MSTIVTMTSDSGPYANTSTYRVRSREAQLLVANDDATIIDTVSVQDADPIEGV